MSGGSFAWKSIMKARRVIKKRAKWRVVDEKKIRIYGDLWLPRDGEGKVISPASGLPLNAVVADLIDPTSGWWDSQIVDQNFLPFEAEKIKAIPISTVAQEEIFIWPKSRDGSYTVKIGYQILCEEQSHGHASSSFPDMTKGLWKGIWKLRVPGKIKHFRWRACSDSLPTKHNFWKRRMVPNEVCEICNSHPETVLHSLWDYEASGAVWNRDFGWIDRRKVSRGDFVDLWNLLQTPGEGAVCSHSLVHLE